MEFEGAIQQVESALRDLTREWERFFAGERPTPPQPQKAALERRLRVLDENADRAADRFRVEHLQSRFMSYCQLWDRQLRAREEGTLPAAVVAPQGRRPTASPNEPRPASVHRRDHEDLYGRYAEAKASLGQQAGVDRETFLARLQDQRERLEAKLGGRVAFDVVVEGGKVRLAARRVAPRQRQG